VSVTFLNHIIKIFIFAAELMHFLKCIYEIRLSFCVLLNPADSCLVLFWNKHFNNSTLNTPMKQIMLKCVKSEVCVLIWNQFQFDSDDRLE